MTSPEQETHGAASWAAREAREDAIASAWRVYDVAVAVARQTYDEAVMAALAAYDAAVKP